MDVDDLRWAILELSSDVEFMSLLATAISDHPASRECADAFFDTVASLARGRMLGEAEQSRGHEPDDDTNDRP